MEVLHGDKTLSLPYQEVINNLSNVNDVIFVGGTSEFLQGVKSTLRDIDISIDDKNKLSHINYVFTNFDDSFYGLSGERGHFKKDNILVDIFIDKIKPPYIITPEGYKCQTIESMIILREKTIELGKIKGTHLEKLKNNLNRLKKWKQLQP